MGFPLANWRIFGQLWRAQKGVQGCPLRDQCPSARFSYECDNPQQGSWETVYRAWDRKETKRQQTCVNTVTRSVSRRLSLHQIQEERMSVSNTTTALPYKVKDINLAEWGRKEIQLAEAEMPGLMSLP